MRYVHVSPTVFGAYPGDRTCADASASAGAAPGSQVTSTSAPTITSRHGLPTSTSTSLGRTFPMPPRASHPATTPRNGRFHTNLILICIFNLMLELASMRSPWILFLLLTGACGGLGNPDDSNSGITTATPSWSTGATSTGEFTPTSAATAATTSGASVGMTATGDVSTSSATSDGTGTSTGTSTTAGTGTGDTPGGPDGPKLDLPPFASSSEGGNDEDKDKDKDVD